MISLPSIPPGGCRILALLSVCIFHLLPPVRVHAASASANYSILHHALAGGGGQAQSARYTLHASTAGFGGFSSQTASGISNFSGFTGQITDEPTALNASFQVALNGAVAVMLTATDPANDPLTFQVLTTPSHGTLSGTAPNLTFQAGASFATFDQFTFVVLDGTFQSAPATVTLVAPGANAPPSITPIPNLSVTQGQLLSLQVIASDPDQPTQSLVFSLGSGSPAGATIDAGTGLFTWTPAESQSPGVYDLVIHVTDDGAPAWRVSRALTITVLGVSPPPSNTAPVLAPISDRTVEANSLLSLTVSASDTDQPAQQIQFSLGPGAPLGAQIDATTGLFTWAPGSGDAGSQFTVTIVATDNGVPPRSASRSFTIAMAAPPPPPPVNSAPVLAPIADRSGVAGSTVSLTASASDSDQPVQQLTFALGAGSPPGAEIHPLTGVFTWTPDLAAAGKQFSITVIVTDSGSPALSASRSFTIAVAAEPPGPINLAPTLAPIDSLDASRNQTITLTPSATDADLPPQRLTFTLDSGAPAAAAIDPVTGVFSWTVPAAQVPGEVSITIRVTDSGAPPLSASQTFQVRVAGPNTPPILSGLPNRTVSEGSLLTFLAGAADRDLPAQNLTYTLEPGAPAGARFDPVTLTFSWTPTEAQGPGVYPVTFRATDDGDPPLSVSGTFRITVLEVNSPPVLAPISEQTVRAGQWLAFTAEATDADRPNQGLTFELEDAPAGAVVDPATGKFTWTPAEDHPAGTVTLRVTVRDSALPAAQVSQVVSIVVLRQPEPPQPKTAFSAGLTETDVYLSLRATPNRCYRIDRSRNLIDWEDAGRRLADASGRLEVIDQRNHTAGGWWYRAVEVSCESVPPITWTGVAEAGGGQLHLKLRSYPRACCVIEVSRDFVTWTLVEEIQANNAGELDFRTPIQSRGLGIYRARIVPCRR